ncbi:hypothetical protein PYW08_015064 [Mythimna loreyi]|uniref:Uncharacterized protein n=1 Tax=Mythimna loreyi TaxID=667449 RepID=A0ACC2R907_9NEOP|nr:hypothetical protein PYW08_015064 [Mythimna loreyi]
MLWLVFVSVVVLWLLVRRFQKRRILQVASKIKCDIKAYPFLGHAYMFIGGGENRMRTFQILGREAIKNGGLTNMWLGEQYYTVVVDPVDLEVILKTSLEKDDVMRFARNLIGNGTIFAPVSIWRPRRKVLAPTFTPKNLNNFVKIFSRQSIVMTEQLQSVAGTGPFSVWKYLTSYTMDSVCETTLGVNVNAQRSVREPFLPAFDECCKLIAARMVSPWLAADAVYKLLPYHDRFETCKNTICSFIDKVIKSKRKTMKENDTTVEKNPDKDIKSFLELLIEGSGGERGYSDLELQEETLVIVVAGTDTSAVGISFAVSMLARHPDVQEKVYEELREVFGDSGRPVTVEDLPRLKYLDAVVRETLRLYPPVPVVVRKIEKDVTLPSGITLVEGCAVLVSIWGTQRNPRYWGEDAELFRPERFLEAPLSHPAAFMAFSYGPRNCLGYQYAMMSMKTALATLIRRYRMSSDMSRSNGCKAEEKPIRLTFDVMMKDVDKFIVQLYPSGITLVEGCAVLVSIWGTQRNPRYWGEDAELFRPERFLEAPLSHPAAFMAFSHGPRNCLGYQYAMMSMKTALATLIRRFRVSSDMSRSNGCKAEEKPIRLTFDVMMKDVDKFIVQLDHPDKGIKSFLELLIEGSGGERGYSDLELQEETLVIVVAGTDTSAVGISFAVSMLARHPDVQEKVYEELREVFGDSGRPVTVEDLPRLKYLDAVVRETLRLYPPVPIVVRKIEKDVTLPSGITLVEGCAVLVSIWGTQRNPRYWGEDAEQFRPERFLEAPLSHPAAFMAFSHGPRNCLGYQYAMMSMKTALATLVRRYRVSSDMSRSNGCKAEEKPIRLTFDVMMKDVDKFIVQLDPSGITLVEGCAVLVSIWGTQRNPRYWGEDAELFRPERFLEAPLSHPAAFMAFSHGPRNCLGYQYAMMSMKTALATLIRRYRVSSDMSRSNGCKAEEKPIRLTFDVMMKDVDKFIVQLDHPDKGIKSFLELLIEGSGGERGYSDLELQEETLVIVVAGTDTSAVGISFAVSMLARHPDVQEKVYEELREVFGDSGRPVTVEDLPRLKYLDAVVRETLRLYPPVPIVVRKIEKDVTLPSGITLVEGCAVLVSIWGTQRNPRYWGEDAEQFRPERFLEAPLSHPAAFMAFSHGPRNCLGYQYVMMSMKTALATLVRRYRVSSDTSRSNGCKAEEKPIRLTFDVMMKDVDMFIVQLDRRKN